MDKSFKIHTVPQDFPKGTVPGQWKFGLSKAGVNFPPILSDLPSATFSGLEDGEYTVSGVRLDTAGNELGTVATAQVTVTNEVLTVSIDVAESISVE